MKGHLSWTLLSTAMEGEEQNLLEVRREDGIIQCDICSQNLVDKSADCSTRNLRRVPQCLFPDVETLVLTENLLGFFESTTFRRYIQLREIYLDKNYIFSIAIDTFYHLHHLEKLVMSKKIRGILPSMDILIFDPRIFQHSFNLKYLDQSCYMLYGHIYDLLDFVPKLETLNLMANLMRDINISSCNGKREKLLINLSENHIPKISPENVYVGCHVDTLILDGNPLLRIDPVTIATLPVRFLSLGNSLRPPAVLKDLFVGVSMSEIEALSIRNAGITHIPADMFDPLQNKPLSLLDLSGNDIILRPFVFNNLSLVSAMYIMDSTFSTIIPEYFYGMDELLNLSLSSNALYTELNPNNSAWKTNLTSLEIHIRLRKYKERLVDICVLDPFVGLHLLKFLNFIDKDSNIPLCDLYLFTLAMNTVEYVIFGVSSGNYLILLEINSAKEFLCFGIGNSPVFSFDFAPYNLQETSPLPTNINMSHAGIRKASIFKAFDQARTFYLNMSYNYIKEIVSGDFDNFSSLETLDLKANTISSIVSDAFVGLVSLRRLYLQLNRLVDISDYIFKEMRNLELLHLDDNQLYYLDYGLFANATMLRTLTLSSNQFSVFNQSTFDIIRSSVEQIDISLNSLICNCDNMWLVNDFGILFINLNITFCSKSTPTLDSLRGKHLTMFVPAIYCYSNRLAHILLVIFLALTLITLLAIIAYRNSYRLKYQFFLLKLTILGYTEITDAQDMDDFEYDMNIMFSDQTKEWATEHFKPMLQERLPNFNRIAFDDDDLILGMHYFDAVYTNVERSFKIVLLLNKEAVQDHIFMTKFRIAMNHVTDTETENMVLVFLENIPEDELPYLVRLYLTGQGEQILWEEDEEGQDYFWYKFERFMRVNLKINHMVPPE